MFTASIGFLDAAHLDGFAAHLVSLGFAPLTMVHKSRLIAAFAGWTRRKEIGIPTLDESHVDAFLRDVVGPRKQRYGRRNTLVLLLRHLRAAGVVAPVPARSTSPMEMLQERYECHLHHERGLAVKSVRLYWPFVRDFLGERFGTSGTVDCRTLGPQDVRDFLLNCARTRPGKTSKLQATALRSFLRFLFQRGETGVDLSLAVPTVRQWRQAAVHPYISPEEVEQVLRACDRSTPVGRRDHVVILLLSRLGLRAGEVVALELGDIRWRAGEILVRGKGRVLDRMPLLPDIGQALALYLSEDRPRCSCRCVFVRMRAPLSGLVGPGAVGHIARRALARAGLRPSLRGAHLFRYSLATAMIRRGASMTEIGEVLRHRSTDTTEIYAKVDFESLRAVALPWPGTGGGR